MYWTWGNDDKKDTAQMNWLQRPTTGSGFE
jgi:hypothetical protein